MTYPQHPALRITPYPGGCDIIPVQSSAGWTAAILAAIAAAPPKVKE